MYIFGKATKINMGGTLKKNHTQKFEYFAYSISHVFCCCNKLETVYTVKFNA